MNPIGPYCLPLGKNPAKSSANPAGVREELRQARDFANARD
jgi:hypothetical protein